MKKLSDTEKHSDPVWMLVTTDGYVHTFTTDPVVALYAYVNKKNSGDELQIMHQLSDSPADLKKNNVKKLIEAIPQDEVDDLLKRVIGRTNIHLN